MHQNLFHLFNSIIPISKPLEERLSETLKTKIFNKSQLVLKEGQVCDNIYFIAQGYLRSYYLKDGKEITAWFMKENDVIVSVNSFFKREPSYEYIQAIEDSVLHYIHYDELQRIYRDFIEFNIIGRVLAEMYYTLSEERLYGMRSQTAEERFTFLLDKHPEIIMRTPRSYIASYLGISFETLSRIRIK